MDHAGVDIKLYQRMVQTQQSLRRWIELRRETTKMLEKLADRLDMRHCNILIAAITGSMCSLTGFGLIAGNMLT